MRPLLISLARICKPAPRLKWRSFFMQLLLCISMWEARSSSDHSLRGFAGTCAAEEPSLEAAGSAASQPGGAALVASLSTGSGNGAGGAGALGGDGTGRAGAGGDGAGSADGADTC